MLMDQTILWLYLCLSTDQEVCLVLSYQDIFGSMSCHVSLSDLVAILCRAAILGHVGMSSYIAIANPIAMLCCISMSCHIVISYLYPDID